MEYPALLLLAVPLPWACVDRADPDNAARAEAAGGPDAKERGNAAADADGGGAAADVPGTRDATIRGDGAGDRASRPADPDGTDPDGADPCGASRYQSLVGRPRSAIPAEPAGATWRIACTSCPITMDYSPARLNIFYDEETQIIEEVRCG
jgi:hypothetical protein